MKKFLLSFGLVVVFAFYVLLNSPRSNATQIARSPITTPTPTPVVTTNAGKYKNGKYTGPAVDAYYGMVQVSTTIQGGAITDVTFLQYPNDRGNSVRINTMAMSILKSEAISAQSASVDGVSGATATSDAFNQSLSGALAMAAK